MPYVLIGAISIADIDTLVFCDRRYQNDSGTPMSGFPWYIELAEQSVNLAFRLIPRKTPSHDRLTKARIIAHRGAHRLAGVKENTMAAFTPLVRHGVWGMECDVHFSKDLIPIISHDDNAMRVFNQPIKFSELTLAEIKKRCPEIPTLAEIVQVFGKQLHLMIEIKSIPIINLGAQQAILSDILQPLCAGEDFHILMLNPDMVELVHFLPKHSLIAVALTNTRQISQFVSANHWGGIAGQFLLLSNPIITHHQMRKQIVGSGFLTSKFALFRELNRGVYWIFTNHPLRLQRLLTNALNLDS